MAKDVYYFSHDSNAREDEKILEMRAEFGWEGYGLFWALVEMLHDANDNRLEMARIKAIAFGLHSDFQTVDKFVKCCIQIGLFVEKDGFFHSESLNRRIEHRKEKHAKRSESGRKGAEKKWQKDSNAMAMPLKNDGIAIKNDGKGMANDGKGKESKENEMKEKEMKGEKIKINVCEENEIPPDLESAADEFFENAGSHTHTDYQNFCRADAEIMKLTQEADVKFAKVFEQWAKDKSRFLLYLEKHQIEFKDVANTFKWWITHFKVRKIPNKPQIPENYNGR